MRQPPERPRREADPAAPQAGPSLRAKALAWLTLREHSTHELRTKLKRWAQARGRDAEAEGLEPLLAALQHAGHLSDARFAESRVHVRAPRLGNRRVEHELRRSRVEPGDALRETLRASELERARAVWARRFAGARTGLGDQPDPGDPARRPDPGPRLDRREWARQARFLAARGFGTETIQRVLRAGEPQDEPGAGREAGHGAAHDPDEPAGARRPGAPPGR